MKPNGTCRILFVERQRFKSAWLWVTLLPIDLFFLYGVYVQIVNGRHFGSKPLSNTGLLIVTNSLLLLTGLLIGSFLETKIKDDGIYVRYFPLQWNLKKYPWDHISRSFVRKYNPIKEFGGWGIRNGPSGKVLSVSGKEGIQLVFHNGTKLLIGTRKLEDVEKVLRVAGHLKV